VTDEVRAACDADDAKLLNMVRAGDVGAFGVLRQRHEQALRRLGRALALPAAEVDDLVAETFARVLDVTRRGGGPTDAVRPYLLTALRLACDNQLRTEPAQVPEEKSLIAAAFFALPERWIAVLWHTEIEAASSAEVAPLLGLSRDEVPALRRRAREGLQQSYLHLHSSRADRPECKPVTERLGAFVRDPEPGPDSALVTEHLSQCDDCRALYAQLADVNRALRTMVAPVVLGTAAASYLSDAPNETAGIAAGHAGTASGHSTWLSAPPPPRPSLGPLRLLAAAAVIAVCSAAFAVSLTGHDVRLASARQPEAGRAATAHPTGLVAPSLTPSGRAPVIPVASTRVPGSSAAAPTASMPPSGAAPGPSGTASSPPAVELAATVNIDGSAGHWHGGQVVFQVSDTGSAATGQLTVSIRLPAGTWMFGGRDGHGGGRRHRGWHGYGGRPPHGSPGGGAPGDGAGPGWSCRPTSTGASCQHSAIPAGGQSQGVIFIAIYGSSACGQSVGLTVTSGSTSASAQSPQDIQC
jgi:DNA-directed RNA polymerase specialized sigma24 family protein